MTTSSTLESRNSALAPGDHRARRPLSARARVIVGLIYFVYVLILLELAARCFWLCYRKVPFLRSQDILYTFYPELKNIGSIQLPIRNDDEVFDVLLLGASVVDPGYGSIGKQLEERLPEVLNRPVRVVNLAAPGRTSRDSLLKFQRLRQHRFDLVVVYHGINETRMNNCPPDLFRDDYGHCSWYRKLQAFETQCENTKLALPYSLSFLSVNVGEVFDLGWYIPRFTPSSYWLKHGGDIKTERAFRGNLEGILDAAASAGSRSMLMTFAHHIPANYTEERFRAKQLDYAAHISPIAIWGTPDNVQKGIEAHNGVIRQLARERAELLFVDQQSQMPKGATYFNDCCHFTEVGCQRFVDHIVEALRAR